MEDINYMDRIHALYHRLPRDPQKSCTIDELKETIRDLYNTGINISSLKRAIQRDLDQLESFLSVGTVLYLDGKGNQPAQYRLSKNALIEKMNSELALILVMANDYIRQCVPDKIYEKVEGFFESATQLLEEDTKLSDWQSRIRFVPDGYGQLNKTAQNELIIQKIYEALLDNNAWLDVLYRKEKSSEQTRYLLKPHGVIQHGQKPYLIASKVVGKKAYLRTFNMLRFDQVENVLEKLYVDVDFYELEDLVSEREFEDAYFNRDKQDIFFIFHKDLLEELQISPISYDQVIKQINDDEYYEFLAHCCITTSLMDWFIKNAHLIQSVRPNRLREEIRNKLVWAGETHCIFDPEIDEIHKEIANPALTKMTKGKVPTAKPSTKPKGKVPTAKPSTKPKGIKKPKTKEPDHE